MKKLFCIVFLLSMVFAQGTAQRLYNDQSASDVTGKEVNIKQFKGKKLLIILLAPDQVSSIADEIAGFKNKNKSMVEIIGLTLPANADPSKSLEANKEAGDILKKKRVLLLNGGNAEAASSLFEWLSDYKNTHSFIKDRVHGTKFLISETGSVMNVFSDKTPLDAPIIYWALKSAPYKEKIR